MIAETIVGTSLPVEELLNFSDEIAVVAVVLVVELVNLEVLYTPGNICSCSRSYS